MELYLRTIYNSKTKIIEKQNLGNLPFTLELKINITALPNGAK